MGESRSAGGHVVVLLLLVAVFLFALPAVANAATLAVGDDGAPMPGGEMRATA